MAEVGGPQAEQLRVLYLTASPDGSVRVDEEMRRVLAGVQAATHRGLVEIRHLPAVTPSDLLDGLTRFRPHVVHFSGHADDSVLLFDTGADTFNAGMRIPAAVFAQAMAALDTPPMLVVLNGCRSEGQLGGLLEAVPLAVGMSDEIGDVDAMTFAARFYTSLADGQSVKASFLLARVQMATSGLSDADLPLLTHDLAIDPADVVLVRPVPAPVRTRGGAGTVHNTISGGNISGNVIQGRDVSGPIIYGRPSSSDDPRL